LILSACSAKEEEAWKSHLLGRSNAENSGQDEKGTVSREIFSTTSLDLKPAGQIFGQPGTLARRLSIQRAATVGTKSNICQIIIKNTHEPKGGNEQQYPFSPSLNRSQSLLVTHRIPILAPKRSDRVRLEQVLADVWTKDTIPYPGMVAARGDQIKASANSVIRKLSLASISGPFTRRSSSLSVLAPCKSSEEEGNGSPTEEATLGLSQDRTQPPAVSLGGNRRLGQEDGGPLLGDAVSATGQKSKRGPAAKFRQVSDRLRGSTSIPTEKKSTEEETKTKKRWSNPFGGVKSISSGGIRGFFG
jgi:hypothetical protein